MSDVLINSVQNVHNVCKDAGYTKYRIDVVIDSASDKPIPANVILVPSKYKTQNESKNKARALHYMVEYRRNNNENDDKCWIFHMDEESMLTTQCLFALVDFIENGDKLIGEGAIVYPNKFFTAGLLTRLADSIRPFGCFECVQQLNRKNSPPIHLHGSNLLCRSDVEDSVGWDFGNVIAEDSIFGHAAFNKFGNIFGWHGGLLEEQPVFNLKDHFKQRLRWYVGAKQSLRLPFLSSRDKLEVAFRLTTWSIGFIAGIVTLISLFHIQLFGIYKLLLVPITILWLSSYQIGLYWNTRSLRLSRVNRLKNHAYLLVLSPILGLVECFPAFIGVFSKQRKFELVKK
jgi:cellulose synthase/poly-beta-1,6-N-acetylglucosamine synthase-like glycosyltransferase